MRFVSDFFAGVRLLGTGFTLVLRRRRLFWFGVIPPLVMSVVFGGLFTLLVINLPWLADWLTPWADGWMGGAERAMEFVAGAALLGGSSLLMIVSFTTLTLAIGAPIYDQISANVETELEPGLHGPEESWTTAIGRSLRNSVILIAISALVAPLFFAAGFIPVVGQSVVPVLSACFGGWMLCIELIGSTFERHGKLRLRERRTAMQRRRGKVLGLAVPTFLLMSIPVVGTLVFPTATAAATLLGRELLGLPTRLPGQTPGRPPNAEPGVQPGAQPGVQPGGGPVLPRSTS